MKLDKSGNFDKFLTYTMAEGWQELKGDGITPETVYYRTVEGDQIGTPYSVLEGNQVTVRDDVTKDKMNALKQDTYPTLTITAYASQLHKNADKKFTAVEAWENVKPVNP